jgi:hypothetical protein
MEGSKDEPCAWRVECDKGPEMGGEILVEFVVDGVFAIGRWTIIMAK